MLAALRKIKSNSVLILVVLVYIYLIFHSVSGSQGIFMLAKYDSKISSLQNKIVRVQGERLTLERRASQLRSSNLSRDLLDQRSRELLSVSYTKELVIILDDRGFFSDIHATELCIISTTSCTK